MNYRNYDNGDNSGKLLAFLAGAATAAAVGGYYLYGPNGKQHRKETEDFIESTKETIQDRMEEAGDWSRETYDRVVNEVTHDTRLVRRIGATRAKILAQRFKNKWQEMRDAAENAAGQAELELAQEDADGDVII
jgi:hypothetical protein